MFVAIEKAPATTKRSAPDLHSVPWTLYQCLERRRSWCTNELAENPWRSAASSAVGACDVIAWTCADP